MPYNEEATLKSFAGLLQTIHRLRAPGGCPWDREQTHQSLRPFLLEETHETLEVLDQVQSSKDLQKPGIKKAFIEEWGDVLLQIMLHAEIASEADPTISFEQIANQLNEKMIRRHPHVFGEVQAATSDTVLKNWEQIKKAEKGTPSAKAGLLETVPKGLPPFLRTMKIIQKVTKAGFQWPDLTGPTEKLTEEVNELNAALKSADSKNEADRKKIESELGDVLFSVCNIAHFMKMDPEAALRSTLRKFESRFGHVEQRLHENGKTLEQSTLEQMDVYWNEAKKQEHE